MKLWVEGNKILIEFSLQEFTEFKEMLTRHDIDFTWKD